MNTPIVNIILALTAMFSLSGRATPAVQQAGLTTDRPILSAAEANAMIRVEFRSLEPASVEPTVVASAD